MTRRNLILIASLTVAAHPVVAQRWAEPGSRIRASALAGPGVVGRVIRWTGDTLEVAAESGGVVRFPMARLQRIDVSRGRSTAAFKGLILGTAAGVGAAGVIALMHPDGDGDLNQGQLFVVAAVGFGAIGLGSGFLLGAFFTVENWERAELGPKLVVGRNPGSRGGLRLSLSL